jgi:membrane-bound lytic murein transglycosylase A
MKLPSLGLIALLALSACRSPDYGRPLPEGWPALLPLSKGEKRPSFHSQWRQRSEILPALEHSIEWMRRPSSRECFPTQSVDHDLALQSLVHFRSLLRQARSGREFDQWVKRDFDVFKSAGWNGKGGGVLFTGYYTPIFPGSEEPAGEYRYPLYGLPEDLAKGPKGEILGRKTAEGGLEPYPERHAIEASGLLKGKNLELAWLRNPLDVFIAHVNGSAFLETEDGQMLRFGYAGKNGRAYTSLGKELVKDKRLRADEVSLQAIRDWAAAHPDEIEAYLDRNESYVFFTPIEGNPHGSLNVPVVAGRSIATDKSLFPRGGLVFVDTKLPVPGKGKEKTRYRRLMLDQDTGGAIRTAGRADLYMGIGPEAERVAGATRSPGQMYYLFLSAKGRERVRLNEDAKP